MKKFLLTLLLVITSWGSATEFSDGIRLIPGAKELFKIDCSRYSGYYPQFFKANCFEVDGLYVENIMSFSLLYALNKNFLLMRVSSQNPSEGLIGLQPYVQRLVMWNKTDNRGVLVTFIDGGALGERKVIIFVDENANK